MHELTVHFPAEREKGDIRSILSRKETTVAPEPLEKYIQPFLEGK
jgi:hypothetical protein